MPDEQFWKRKLAAFLHDPPCKVLDIPQHEEIAKDFRKNDAGIDDVEFHNISDLNSAAADRCINFPSSIKVNFSKENPFRHPFGGDPLYLGDITSALAEEKFKDAIRVVPRDLPFDYKKFYLLWGRWPEKAPEIDEKLAYLPADTRIPDHTIWNHMSITSAIEACHVGGELKPAFLLFQLGPVQDFIAQARSTRDLWSGSYLLSWLSAHAMKTIAESLGPDNIITPSLRGQRIMDILFKESFDIPLLDEQGSLWDKKLEDEYKDFLNPTIPNRFLALIPQDNAEEYALNAQKAVSEELSRIGESCWKWLKTQGIDDNWREMWERQIRQFPHITWTIVPWEMDTTKALAKYKSLPINRNNGETPCTKIEAFFNKFPPSNAGALWSINYAIAEFVFAARRNCRNFEQVLKSSGDEKEYRINKKAGFVKDSLSGKEEAIGGEEFWKKLSTKFDLFKKAGNHRLGAISLIKRLWCWTETGYLLNATGMDVKDFKSCLCFDSVKSVAEENENKNPYVAIIAMDGDHMGRWLSGENMPKLKEVLSAKASEGITEEFRILNPSFHLQFSEALSNFACKVAGKVAKAFNGQLIYAGGDDVMIMLPADKALECATALRHLFKGEYPTILKENKKAAANWAKLKDIEIKGKGWLKLNQKSYPLMMPGPKSDVSCGIAIAHNEYPLQHIVEEARSAERRAKNNFDRTAFAVSLIKRSGETIHWGANWESGALELYFKFREFGDDIANKFPYQLATLLRQYNLDLKKKIEDISDFNKKEVILAEFTHILKRQAPGLNDDSFKECAEKYLDSLAKVSEKKPERWDEFEKLFLTAAFIERKRGE